MRDRVLRSASYLLGLALALAAPLAAGDTLLMHGHIYTGNPKAPWAEALVIRDGRLSAIGTDRAMKKLAGSQDEVLDLHGQTVIPGIIDSHVHLLYGAYALHALNLTRPQGSITVKKPEELVAQLKAYAAAYPQDPIVMVRADFSAAPPSTPTTELLDRAVPDRPVVVHNSSEHSLWVNTPALKLAGITDYPLPDPAEERGVIRNASGRPTGTLIEAAMEAIERAVDTKVPRESKLEMISIATRYLNSYGITSIVNATGSLEEIGLYATLHEQGKLTVRTRTAFGSVSVPHRLTQQFLADLEQARSRYQDDWVSANLVKFFADGFSGLIPPLVYEPHEYESLVTELDRRGYQVMTHAARSDSVHMILDTYERVQAKNGMRDRRMRIEHADVTDATDIPRFSKLGVTVVMQPSFCCASTGLNYDTEHQLATDRWHTFLAAGTELAFSSDWPCTLPPDPFLGIQQAVLREVWRSADTESIVGNPFDGAGQGGAVRTGGFYVPEERIGVMDAVKAYTQGSAYAAFMDERAGTLEVGKQADLVVLSQDLFAVPATAIAATHAVMTMVGGQIVYRAEGH